MKRVLIAINFDEGLYNFRKELLEALVREGHEVHLAVPRGEFAERLEKMGCTLHDTSLDRRGTNPLRELSLLARYRQILKEVKPAAVLTYTIKPNVYMGILCGFMNIPCMTTVTGLGTAFEGGGLLGFISHTLYRLAERKAEVIFFQNEHSLEVFERLGIRGRKHKLLPGSGVNLEHFRLLPFPEGEETTFLFISRIMEEKGIAQFMDAAEHIKAKHSGTRFKVLGFMEEDYRDRERFDRLVSEGIIEFEGSVEDVVYYLDGAQCTLHPSFYPEGMSNVCLESAACGRAVITTDRPGCRDTVIDGVSGYVIPEKNSTELIGRIEQFLALSIDERRKMGEAGRRYMEERFDRKLVVAGYLEAIEAAVKGRGQ